jgi:histone-lysine N-methyltransferase SUV420H
MAAGTVITELKGSMANLTTEEDQELKRTDLRNSDIRRDFSVIHSKQMKKNHLFLGPARFVNVRINPSLIGLPCRVIDSSIARLR